ncbi:isochorismatase family protein [Desulforhopalus singaporensis]|uniref:Nicotinamidase-related amidase n=1 Tax=Desulforhopalus singaporensis TaxID=91360 RepID=A0A1H0JQW9_9BACT|nr:isochorismatase family protein [Desulforhopalus singaporensis]SDO45933.1 Nicotinamidase-related amidase [Desulforhopalus singaporensis]
MKPTLLKPENVCLHIIDVQKSLMAKIDRADSVIDNIVLMIEVARILDIPIIANTQYEKGLGPYVDRVESYMDGVMRFDKVEFSAMANPRTRAFLEELPSKVSTVILVGVESHICIYQTAAGLLDMGKDVWVVTDAVSSIKREDHEAGIDRILRIGGSAGPTQMLIYELLGRAGSAEFKEVLPHIIRRQQ